MLTFRFRLTEEEYFRYNYFTAWADPRRKKYRMIYFLRVIILYGSVALVYIVAKQAHEIWIDATVFLATGLIYLLLIPYFIRMSVRRKVHTILSKKENQHVLDDAEIILSDKGIIDRDTHSESRYDWDAIVYHADTPEGLYLYTNSYHAIVIPKRAFKTDEELKETERLLYTHLQLHA